MTCDNYQDLVAAHVDGALTAAESAEVTAHLSACASCRHLFEEETRFHAAFAARRFIVPVPADVERRLRNALSAEREARQPFWARLTVWPGATPMRPRLALGLAVAGLLMAILLPRIFRSAPAPNLFARAMHYYQAVTEGALPVEYVTEDPQGLQASFNTSGRLDFTTQVTNLQPAGYRLKGGRVVTDAEHPLAVSLYEGKEEEPIVCLRQRGTLPLLPEGTEGGNGHYWYMLNGYTAMFTQFPDHFCVMISRQPKELFLQRLAMAPAS